MHEPVGKTRFRKSDSGRTGSPGAEQKTAPALQAENWYDLSAFQSSGTAERPG